ncbi:MAG: ribbon-helix-helix domain-containing protein [Bdellovibrionales bacterium]
MIDGFAQEGGSANLKRSVLIAGHRTSVSLEPAFWEELCVIAKKRGLSVNQLVAEIDAARTGNLSSALRLYVLKVIKES